MKPSIYLGAVLTFLAAASSASANYVVNGNFSTVNTVTPNSIIYNYSGLGSSSFNVASYLTGWNVKGNNASSDLAFVYSGNYGANVNDQYGGFALADSSHITASTDGGNFVVADGDSGNSVTLYQTFTNLAANTTYVVQYYQATGSQAGFSPSGSADWQVSFGNATDGYATYSVSQAVSSSFSGWTLETTTFTTGAHSTSETLSFLSQGPSGVPPMLFLDGVTLNTQVSAAPEPATLAIGGMGLALLVAARQRRKSRS